MIFGLCRIPIPPLVNKVTDSAVSSIMPCAMIVTGMVLAEKQTIKFFFSLRVYIAVIVRLLIIPLALFLILKLAGMSRDIIFIAVTIMAMPMNFNVIVFPKAYGGDATLGTQLVVISNILALITLPLIMGIV